MTQAVKINDQNFIFHSSGAMFWQEKSMLLISDVHLGKISHFRKFGSAVPHNAIAENFKNLSEVVSFFCPQKICFLGDLFHSVLNREWALFEAWIRTIASEVILIVGNHDIISELKYEEIGVKIGSELLIDNYFILTHHPEKREEFFNICGHLHPGYKLRGRGRQSIKLRCFFKTDGQLILPAFGTFTGNYWISPSKGDRIYAITKKEVISVF